MSSATQSRQLDAAVERPSGPPAQDPAAVAELGELDGLAAEELRAMPCEELQILASTGC